MGNFVSIEEAIRQSGMRLICVQGLPGAWGEAVKGILDVKRIPYTKGLFVPGADQSELIAWSAQSSAPVLAWNDEFPRSNWAEQLYLAERVEPTPRLIPEAVEERVRMFGFCNEICGENGLGWSRRLMIVHQMLSTPGISEESAASSRALGAKYGYSADAAQAAPARVAAILDGLSELLESSRASGNRYFIGRSLTALDIYWATFSHLIDPLPPDQCPMIEAARPMYRNTHPGVAAATRPSLMEHREFVYREHLGLPMDL